MATTCGWMCNFCYENVKPKLNNVGLKCVITHVNANCASYKQWWMEKLYYINSREHKECSL